MKETHEFKIYEQVCRGELTQSVEEKRYLHCKYNSNNIPYRLLQPFKMEVLNLDPYVIFVYDIIGNEDISILKHLAKPQMSRSKVFNNDGSKELSHFRTSQNAWLFYEDVADLYKFPKYIGELSGLDVSNAEAMQVAYYGIGAKYEPHWDFFKVLNANINV